MMIKDFNRHKSNGGITQPTTVDVIKTFKHNGKKGTKTSSSHRMSGQSTRDSKKPAVSVTLCISLKTVQLLAKSATNVVLRTISARVADHHGATDKTQTDAEVEHQHVVGALRDITDPAEAGTPDQDHIQRSGLQNRNTHSIK